MVHITYSEVSLWAIHFRLQYFGLGVLFGQNGVEFTISENIPKFLEFINDIQFQFQNFKIISDSDFRNFLELEFFGDEVTF